MVSLKVERGNGVGLCMGPSFVNVDYDTPLLLPPNLRDWVSSDHLSRFILDAVEELEWALVSTAYNLKRLQRMVGTG